MVTGQIVVSKWITKTVVNYKGELDYYSKPGHFNVKDIKERIKYWPKEDNMSWKRVYNPFNQLSTSILFTLRVCGDYPYKHGGETFC